MVHKVLKIVEFSASYGDGLVVKNVNMEIENNKITAVMGPSGCGKSTLLRCVNRLHELNPNTSVAGNILLNDQNIYQMNAIMLRRHIGMVFQRPNPFPTMSIYDNVIAGYKLNGIKVSRTDKDHIVE